MAAKHSKNRNYRTEKRAARSTEKSGREKRLMMTNALLATGVCSLIIASLLIMYSRTKGMTFGMPGGLFLSAVGAAAIGMSYSDIAKKFSLICYAAAVAAFACAVATLLGSLGIVS